MVCSSFDPGILALSINSFSVGPGIRHVIVTFVSLNSLRRAKEKLSMKDFVPL